MFAGAADWGAPAIVVANAGSRREQAVPADRASRTSQAMLDVNLTGVFATWQAGLGADAGGRAGGG